MKIYFSQVETESANDEEHADDAFLMVSQLHWEDDVIWNGDDIRHKVCEIMFDFKRII